MTIKTPEELGKKYWTKNEEERFDIWIKLLTDELNITEGEAKEKIQQIRSLPLIDEKSKISLRFESAVQTLYEISPICPYHNRRHGATMASAALIFKLSGATNFGQEQYWYRLSKKMYGNMSDLHLKLGLSESNVNQKRTLKKIFSTYDIIKGIRVPLPYEIRTSTKGNAMRCLGYACGDGILRKKEYTLLLMGRKVDYPLYLTIQMDFDKTFNFWKEIHPMCHKEKEKTVRDMNYRFEVYSNPTLVYNSKAIWKWFRNWGFPIEGEEKHLPTKLINETNNRLRGFTKGLIATTAKFYQGCLKISEHSKNILVGYENVLSEIGIECCTPYKECRDESYSLIINENSTKELWEQDLCSLNPWLQSKMDEFYKQSNTV